MNHVLCIIMAGGEGTRLSVLAHRRAKPAVPFGGIYRIIDFTLSNIMRSGLRHVGIVTQYRPYSLVDHIGLGEWWGLAGFGRRVQVLSPHTGTGHKTFYTGTGDAIFRNIEFIERFPQIREVLILSGDHIYKMDYRPMIEFHRETGARLTIATQEVPWEETSRFGIMVTDPQQRITQFQEKPKANPLSNKASLGIYVFDRKCLIDALHEDQANPQSGHDFGGDIIPSIIHQHAAYNYDYEDYWRDVGTVDSYMDTNMEAIRKGSGLDLASWDVRTNHQQIDLAAQCPSRLAGASAVRGSLVSKGSLIEGTVEDSIISPGVRVGKGAVVRRSILLHRVRVGEGAILDNVIADKNAQIGDHTQIGTPELGNEPNERNPHLLGRGTSLLGHSAIIPPRLRLGRNTLVFPGVKLNRRSGQSVQSGTTFYDSND